MSGFLTSSIGKKLIMSITGLFLILFLALHATINVLLLFSADIYNEACHFMVTNPLIRIMEPVLALGFVFHIFYGAYLTLLNRKARPTGYAKSEQAVNASFSSRNMFILGGMIFVFLALHIVHFYAKIKFGEIPSAMVDGVEMHDVYALVTTLLQMPLYAGLYVLGAVLLGLHLTHGFWSAFQTIGWSNDIWRKRLTVVGHIYAVVVAGCFAIIPIVLLIKSL